MSQSPDDHRIRCLIAKVGLDGHQRGVQIIARAWRDAGFEVIYLGLRNTPEEFARVAVDEGVDVAGISILSGSHLYLTGATRRAMDEAGAAEVPLIVGGVIPRVEVDDVLAAGAARVLGPGSTLEGAVAAVHELTR